MDKLNMDNSFNFKLIQNALLVFLISRLVIQVQLMLLVVILYFMGLFFRYLFRQSYVGTWRPKPDVKATLGWKAFVGLLSLDLQLGIN